jgi:CspA family cold shock protein
MLNIVHLLAGVAALLLAGIAGLKAGALPWLQQPDALYLALLGLLNLLQASTDAHPRRPGLRYAASALLLIAVLLQALCLLLPLQQIGGQPGILFSLLCATLACALQLASGLQLRDKPAARHAHGSPRESGTVKWFNTSKGFGFISRDTGDDIFVHFRAIRGDGHRVLVEGQRVEFVVMQRDKGLQAEDVTAEQPPRR